MQSKRPKLQIPLSKFEIFIELISVIIFIMNFIMVILAWNKLPSIIPSHFNAAGEIDGYGSKATLLILIPVIAILYAGLTLLANYPYIFNYAVEINEQNAEFQYRLARTFVRILKAELVMIFIYLEYSIIMSAFNSKLGLGITFLPISLVAVFGSIGYYIYRSVKMK